MSKSKITILYKGSLEDVLAARNLQPCDRFPFAVIKFKNDIYEIYTLSQTFVDAFPYEEIAEEYKEACRQLNDYSILEDGIKFANLANIDFILIW